MYILTLEGIMPTDFAHLHHAVSILAAVCDGAVARDHRGFNKPDAPLGATLALTPLYDWTGADALVAFHLLHTYRRQLTQHGIDYDAFPRPEDVPEVQRTGLRERPRRLVCAIDDGLVLVGRSPSELDAVLGDIPGAERRQDPGPHWYFSGVAGSGVLIRATMARLDIPFGQGVEERLEAFDSEGSATVPQRRVERDPSQPVLRLYFPKQAGRLKDAVRALRRRVFREAPTPHWEVPLQREHAAVLRQLIRDFRFTVEPEAEAALAALEAGPPPAPTAVRRVARGEGVLRLYFPRSDMPTRDAVKAIPGWRFVPADEAHWTVPADPRAAGAVSALTSGNGWALMEGVAALLAELSQAAAVLPPERRVTMTPDGVIKVFFPKADVALRGAIKTRAFGSFVYDDPEGPHWQVRPLPHCLAALLELADGTRLTCTAEVRAALEALIARSPAQGERRHGA